MGHIITGIGEGEPGGPKLIDSAGSKTQMERVDHEGWPTSFQVGWLMKHNFAMSNIHTQ